MNSDSESEGELTSEPPVLIDERRVNARSPVHSAAVAEVVGTDWVEQLADNSNWMQLVREVDPVDQFFADSDIEDWIVEEEILQSVL